MKVRFSLFVAALSVQGFSLSVQAHAPYEEMAPGEMPDCAVMQPSEGMNMDKNDPVTQAMIKKCMGAMQGSNDALVSGQETQSEGSANRPGHRQK